ncbi:MAG: heme-dependent oxidative N-demethylase subunit alpha family protein [Bacillota bacterium]
MSRSYPFPLASGRYEVGPSMRRFGQAGQGFEAEEAHFQPDDRLAETLAAKLNALRQAPRECHLFAPGLSPADEAGLRTAMQQVFRLVAAEHPALVTADEAGATLHHLGLRLAGWAAPRLEQVGQGLGPVASEARAWLAGREGLDLLGSALGLAVQEDLAIVRGPSPGKDDMLEWLHVCLPSNWSPAEKIGGSFGTVHEPVVHSKRLLANQGQIVRAIIQAGPFVRYVWGIHRDGELCHNPRIHQAPPWEPDRAVEQAWFRVERQTTHGFPRLNRALFTIRYWVVPLVEVAADPWQRERLATALAGMDEAELAYKGLVGVRDRLVGWLQKA